MRILRSVVAIALLSCGGGSSTQIPAKETGKKHQPLAVKKEAKVANQAVVLGTDDKNGSTVITLPTGVARVNVDALFVRMGGGEKASGGYSPVKLSTAPNDSGSVEVSIGEEFSGGTGPQWRAGVWISAFVAATTLNKDLTDFSFQASSVGYIDGASASGLMSGGFLAAITGAEVSPEVTMTGIINPDGSIGPVGGIPEKFAGAIEKGKKRLGFPIGMRFSRSEATGEMVDLVKLAKDKGAIAVEIGNVHDAYKFLTGKELPEVIPVSDKDMDLDADTSKLVEDKYGEWKKNLNKEWEEIVKLAKEGKLPRTLLTVAKAAYELGTDADKLHQQGIQAAALSKIFEAWVYATTATTTYKILTKIQSGDVNGAVAMVGELESLDQATMNVFHKIGKVKPNTMGGHLQMMSAFQSALRAWSFQIYASQGLDAAKMSLMRMQGESPDQLQSPDLADSIVQTIEPAILEAERTNGENVEAEEILAYETEKTVNYMCSLPNVKRLSTSFASASAAAVTYFETLSGVSDDITRQRAAMVEPDYLLSYLNSRLQNASGTVSKLKDEWGENSIQWGLMQLAGSQNAYFSSAVLIAKYYSLGVHRDEAGRATSLEYEKAFVNMLARAEHNARASARAARIATGNIPVQAKLAYQVGQHDREGTMDDKMHALQAYWSSSAFSQAAVMLARN